jgi:hypothetical protein
MDNTPEGQMPQQVHEIRSEPNARDPREFARPDPTNAKNL